MSSHLTSSGRGSSTATTSAGALTSTKIKLSLPSDPRWSLAIRLEAAFTASKRGKKKRSRKSVGKTRVKRHYSTNYNLTRSYYKRETRRQLKSLQQILRNASPISVSNSSYSTSSSLPRSQPAQPYASRKWKKKWERPPPRASGLKSSFSSRLPNKLKKSSKTIEKA